MKQALEYKIFNRKKSKDGIRYTISMWMLEFEFIKIELAFLKRLIKTYLFKASIPNLFERIQLFILEFENFEKEKNILIDKIYFHHNHINGTLDGADLSYNNLNIIEYEKLAEEVFNYLQNYKNLKIKLFEYMNGLII